MRSHTMKFLQFHGCSRLSVPWLGVSRSYPYMAIRKSSVRGPQCHEDEWRGVERQERRRSRASSSCCCCFVYFLLLFVYLLAYFIFFCWGELQGWGEDMGGTKRCVELRCMMWNSQRANEDVKLKRKERKSIVCHLPHLLTRKRGPCVRIRLLLCLQMSWTSISLLVSVECLVSTEGDPSLHPLRARAHFVVVNGVPILSLCARLHWRICLFGSQSQCFL